MKSVLNVTVSSFASYRDNIPKPVNLLNWLKSDAYAHKVIAIRKISDKLKRDKIKATLPAVTVSGLFEPSRRAEHLVQHSGLICIDIDRKGNEGIDFKELKYRLFEYPFVAYIGLSVSGKGLFLIIPISNPKKHRSHFQALEKEFRAQGIVIDQAPKNVASLRGYSYDPESLLRHDAQRYSKTFDPRIVERKFHSIPCRSTITGGSTKDRVEALIKKIVDNRIDITATEPDWFRIACALANEFGEQGREYFHLISQFHPEYNYHATNRKYDQVFKRQYHKISVGTLFKIAENY